MDEQNIIVEGLLTHVLEAPIQERKVRHRIAVVGDPILFPRKHHLVDVLEEGSVADPGRAKSVELVDFDSVLGNQ